MENTINLYSKREIMIAVRRQLDTWNTGRPHIDEALKVEELKFTVLGIIDVSLPEPEKVMPFSQLYDNSQPLGIGA